MPDPTSSTAVLLALYRAAREMPAPAFPAYALRLIKPLLSFDSAIWGEGLTDGNRLMARAAFLYAVDPTALSEWKEINCKDPVTQFCITNVGATLHAQASTLSCMSADAAYREYLARWRRKDMLVTAVDGESSGALQWISLYRHTSAPFSDQLKYLCQSFVPHLAEALRINRVIDHGRKAGVPAANEDKFLALAGADGRLQFAQRGFLDLLGREWSQTDDVLLPSPLIAALAEKNVRFIGNAIKLWIQYAADICLLEAEEKSRFDILPPQRARVAALFAEGHSYKEIARRMCISPATVRNQIAAAYRDLGVSTRNQLADLRRGILSQS